MRKGAMLLVSLGVVGALGVAFWRYTGVAAAENRAAGPAARAPAVEVARVRRGDVPVVLSGLGTVVPNRAVAVRSRVAGQLVDVAFREGQLVRRGELLAQLDPRPFRAEVDKAQGLLLRERALLENANVEFERAQALADSALASEQQVAAQRSLRDQYQGAEKIAQGGLEAASLQLGFTKVTAPIAGRLGLRLIDEGNNVTPADTLVQIHEVQPIAVVFSLTEDQVQAVLEGIRSAQEPGHELVVEAWDKGSRNLLERGRLLSLDNQIDTSSGTVRLKAEFPNLEDRLFPSQFVNVRLTVDELSGALSLPRAAVQRGRDGPFAYVVGEGGAVVVKPLTLGVVNGESVVVTEGIAEGERVVVSGADQIREGSRVQPIERTLERPRRP